MNNLYKHVSAVKDILHMISGELIMRGLSHDASKFESPEKEIFNKWTPKLSGSTYGTPEYFEMLQMIKPALDHHYEHNRHHPEHFSNGYRGMTIVDIVEMFCDWVSSSRRHDDGNIYESIKVNQKRFGLSDDIVQIFENTVSMYFPDINKAN